MQRDDSALITVHGDARVVETFFRVTQLVAQICDAALKNASEITRD